MQNLESFFGKGFNFVSGKLLFGWADSRFGKPRISLRGSTACHFLRRAKSNIKSTRDSVLRPRFKALSEKISAKFSGGMSRTRLFAQNGGEKALNRCDAPALQRKELERTSKEQRCSLVDSRLWLGANLQCRLRKWVAFAKSKKVCSNG